MGPGLLVCLVLLAVRTKAATVDNGVIGDPEIECGSSSITLQVETQKNFEGHVYVKGHYDDVGCRTPATLSRAASISVNFNSCGVRRERRASPKGVFLSVVVVVTFHPMFITMVDKAYNVRCFYMETDKTVDTGLTVSLNSAQHENIVIMMGGRDKEFSSLMEQIRNGTDISMLSTSLVTQSIPMPQCRYEVLQDNADGAAVRFASVGQMVYHKWTCDADRAAEGVFCMEVHSCYVNDNQGKNVQLLDESGCAIDRYLFSRLQYISDLSGGQQSMVFKFADKSSLHFQCQIRLTVKEGNSCPRESLESCPAEPGRRRAKRSSDSTGENIDVYTDSITVLEIDEPLVASLDAEELRNLNERHRDTLLAATAEEEGRSSLCLSPVSFGILMAVLGVVLLTSVGTAALVCLRYPSRRVKDFS